MKLVFLSLFLILVACSESPKTGNANGKKYFEFKLIDNLGSVFIAIPDRADTFFSWIQRSDCGPPCEHVDYRFQSKKNRIFKQSGFFWNGEPEDSVDQLSIYHQREFVLSKNDDSAVFRKKEQILFRVLENGVTRNVLSDTIVKIYDRYFYIFKIAYMVSGQPILVRKLIAFTTVSGTLLEFQYVLFTRNYNNVVTGFYDKSMENLLTVRLKDDNK